MAKRLNRHFLSRPATELAPELIGKLLCRRSEEGILRYRIMETECYFGQEDTACHASKGKTERTRILFEKGGTSYVYLCYGMHWLMNVITGEPEQPQGVLIRAGAVHDGPAKLTKYLQIDKAFNGKSFVTHHSL